MADVKVPGVGEVPKAAVFGGVGVVLVLIIMYYRSHGSSSSSTSSTAAATDQYPPDGTTGNPADPNSIDPSTGVTYGNEGIGSGAAASAYGLSGGSGGFGGYDSGTSYPWDGTTGNPNDPYSMDPSTGATYGAEGNPGTVANTSGPPFTSNAAWSQYAENYLTGTVGLDGATVSSALGAYLSGQQVTPAQKDIIDQAVAIAGNPPVTGAGGYPPSIRLSAQPAGGNGPKTQQKPPAGPPAKPGSPAISAHAASPTSVVISWAPAAHATSYTAYVTYQGSEIGKRTVSGTSVTIGGLTPDHTYTPHVTASGPGGSTAAQGPGVKTPR